MSGCWVRSLAMRSFSVREVTGFTFSGSPQGLSEVSPLDSISEATLDMLWGYPRSSTILTICACTAGFTRTYIVIRSTRLAFFALDMRERSCHTLADSERGPCKQPAGPCKTLAWLAFLELLP